MAHRVRGWRRIAQAVWDEPHDPQILGMTELDATAMLDFIRRARLAGEHVTPTHLVGRAMAVALRQVPSLNVRIRHGREWLRDSVQIFFITSVGEGHDLSGVKISGADSKPAVEIARELSERATHLKTGQDPQFSRTKRIMDRAPLPLLRAGLRLGAWLAGEHARHVPVLDVAPEPFGSAIVSSVGMLGLPIGFAPLSWMYKVPLAVCVGELHDAPVAVDGKIEIRPMLPVTATIDHRFVDGAQISRWYAAVRDYLADPAAQEPALPPQGARVEAPSAEQARLSS